jgi:hypothetical protein
MHVSMTRLFFIRGFEQEWRVDGEGNTGTRDEKAGFCAGYVQNSGQNYDPFPTNL